MEKTGFTPGPWSADENIFYLNSHGSERHIRSSERHWSICATYQMSGCSDPVRDISADEERANARLIAAAPELYAVVKAMANLDDSNNTVAIGDMARAALSKVEG